MDKSRESLNILLGALSHIKNSKLELKYNHGTSRGG